VWGIKCLGRCGEAVPPLKTSVSLYGDDFEINHQINYATISCAVPFERLNDFMRTIGYAAPLPAPPSPRSLHPHPTPPYPPTTPLHLHPCAQPAALPLHRLGQLSTRDHYASKAELEQPLARAAEASMAAAWEQEQRQGVPQREGCTIVDAGWDHGRNGSTAVMPVMSVSTGRILELELARRSDPGANSSQCLEKRCFNQFLGSPLTALMQYQQVAMDGCAPLIAAARKVHI
jgi:hypothetical protein